MCVLWDILYVKDWHYNGFDIESFCPDSKVHGAHLGLTGPRWAPWWPHDCRYLGGAGNGLFWSNWVNIIAVYCVMEYCNFLHYWPWILLWLKSISNAYHNYANPVYCVATICHQVRCLRWGHPSLFHTATPLLILYKMFCMRDISYRLTWMKCINMLSVYAQYGMHMRVNWWIIAVLT